MSDQKNNLDWSSFLGLHDLAWEDLPKVWMDAPFLGNGMLGTMIFQTGENIIRWNVGRGDVQDHRLDGDLKNTDMKNSQMVNTSRLPIGYFELQTEGVISGGDMHLNLWNAEAQGSIETDKGHIRWRTIVHAEKMLILTEIQPDTGEKNCKWVWVPEGADSPRAKMRNETSYTPNPSAIKEEFKGVQLCRQPLLCGAETCTGWNETVKEDGRTLLISVDHKMVADGAKDEVLRALNEGKSLGDKELFSTHREWWHQYYPKSFVSISDTFWEGFYWVQMYKLASATRADRMLIDNQGPWLQPTPWPGAWWDLNVQLTYWPTYTSNRLDLGDSLNRSLFQNAHHLVENVDPKYRHDSAAIGCASGQDLIAPVEPPEGKNNVMMGLLLWALHNSWLHYRRTMDDQTLRDDLYPLLKRAVSYYFHFITKDEEGLLHLPSTWSPEYKTRPGMNIAMGPDCNFDLSLLRWGLKTLIEICDRLEVKDSLLDQWQDALDHLAPFPCDENGYMIGAGIPFDTKHRHYSHLLMAYPLYLVNADQEGSEKIVMKSLKHWQSFGAAHGYSCTGASSIASAFGKGDDALMYLNNLKAHISPTTMYAEHTCWPVIETPLSGAQAIHDMLLQSWGSTIRVFPALPQDWDKAIFHDLLAEGSFLVSASYSNKKTNWIKIKSLAGEPCQLKHKFPNDQVIRCDPKTEVRIISDDLIEIDLERDSEVRLWVKD
jgi:alpha-L-fucosidase 2